MELYVSSPLLKIIAIATLNSLSPSPKSSNEGKGTLANQSSTSSSSKINALPVQNSVDACELALINFFGVLKEPTYLPFLLRLRSICPTDLHFDTNSLFLMSDFNVAIETYPSKVHVPLVFLYHMHTETFKKYLDAYGASEIPKFISSASEHTASVNRFLKEFDEHAQIVIFPYRYAIPRHYIVSTGNTLHAYDSDSESIAVMRMTIVGNNFKIYSDSKSSSPLIIRISLDGKWAFIDIHTPHKPAVPGTIYAIIFSHRFDTYHLVNLLWSLNNNIELIADTLEDFKFSLFSVFRSSRNSK